MTSNLIQIFEQAFRDLRPRTPLPEFEVRFYRFTNINCTIRLRQGRIFVRLSDLLEGAPEPVLYAILHILIAKLHRKRVDAAHAARYRKFTGSHAMAQKSQLIRQLRGRKRIEGPIGKHYDLDLIFEELNLRFFHGLMARPQMTWSGNKALRSRVFDSPRVPLYAIEYLVYHEMLHLRHPVKLRGSRRLVHPAAFREEEKLFPQFKEAQDFLKRLGTLD
jgi:hypothetical protein